MGSTTYYQYPYPEPTASVDVARDVKALAEKLELMKNGLTIPTGVLTVGTGTDTTSRTIVQWRHVNAVPYALSQYIYNSTTSGMVWTLARNGVQVVDLRVHEDGSLQVVKGGIVRHVPFATYAIYSTVVFTLDVAQVKTHTFPTSRFTAIPMPVAVSRNTSFYAFINDVDVTFVTVGIHYYDNTGVSTTVGYNVVCHQLTPSAGGNLRSADPEPPAGSIPCQVTCHTAGCEADGETIPIRLPAIDGQVDCGVCAEPITDIVQVQLDVLRGE